MEIIASGLKCVLGGRGSVCEGVKCGCNKMEGEGDMNMPLLDYCT